ncbi:hypothetical protein NL676_005224 [Syzygium grande]|nr:hypothetical protein NL676_005224 [Syzygium grande]
MSQRATWIDLVRDRLRYGKAQSRGSSLMQGLEQGQRQKIGASTVHSGGSCVVWIEQQQLAIRQCKDYRRGG